MLFLADIRVDWNEYRRAITTNTTGRTVITENPNTVKATNLKHFMTSIPFQASGKIDQIINKYMDRNYLLQILVTKWYSFVTLLL